MRLIPHLLVVATVSGCSSPLHLTYDHGRAFTEAFTAQPDLTRPAIASSTYPLGGQEAVAIRLLVRKDSTDSEDTKAQLK